MSGVLCCVVSRGTTILAKYASVAGNFTEICDLVLARIKPGDGRMSLSHGEYQYHYTTRAGIITMAMANIDVIMERGEKLDLLIDKTENLSANSVTFRTTSRNLRRSMW